MIKQCVICGSHNIAKHVDTFTVSLRGSTVSVDDVQSYKCEQCGEIYYPQSSALYIEQQIKPKLKGDDR